MLEIKGGIKRSLKSKICSSKYSHQENRMTRKMQPNITPHSFRKATAGQNQIQLKRRNLIMREKNNTMQIKKTCKNY